MTSTNQTLLVRGLSKAYRRRPVLEKVDIEVAAGDAVAVIGPNGAGKSTLFGCLTGERLPDHGTIRICGFDPFTSPAEVASCLGFVPENPFLYGELTVDEMLRFIAQVRSLDANLAAAEKERLLGLLGLTGAEGVLCRELSQGMGRKVAVIGALLHRPRLLILDEAFNGLDSTSSEHLLRELEERKRSGTSILLSSHDLARLGTWCDRGLVLAPTGWTDLSGERWERWKNSPGLTPAEHREG